MSVINELCGIDVAQPRNTGSNNECIEGVLKLQFAARTGFAFPTLTAFKTKQAWLDAIEAKDIIPLYTARVVTNANTDPVFYTTGDYRFQTAPPVEGLTYECYLGLCSHAALDSIQNTEYNQLFDLNNDDSFLGVMNEDGSVRGRKATINVGIRQRPVLDKPATTLVTVTYADYKDIVNNGVLVKTTFGSDLRGIFDIVLNQVSATTTTIRFTAITDCGNRPLTTLTGTDVIVRNAAGVIQTVTFVPADANGVYQITATAVADGWTVEVDGVIVIVDTMYEADGVLTVNI